MVDSQAHHIALGRLEVAFSGQDFIAGAALEEVEHHSRDCASCTGRLEVRFGSAARPAPGAVRIDRFLVGPDGVRVDDPLLRHSLRREGPRLEVGVETVPGYWTHPVVAPVVRLVDQSFNDAAGRLAKRFYYTIFDQAVQLAQLPLGQSWMHASAVTDGDRTVVFMAGGGVGKTAALLSMLGTGAWRFLSDDLCALDTTGTVYRSPHRVQVFAANLPGREAFQDHLLAGRSALDRAHWAARRRVLGEPSVRRRVHAEDLVGAEAVAVSGLVTDAVYLRRTTASGFTVDVATPRDLARLGAAVLEVELDPLHALLAAVHSAAPSADWPTNAATSSEAAAVVEAGLKAAGSRCVVVGVPVACGPDELLRFVRERVLN
jgi:hypothetical protein